MMACLADGSKLPPYIIFKRKTLPKDIRFPRRVHVRVHPKGWMDEKLMVDWIATVWASRAGELLKKRSLLVLHAFRCHCMPSIKKELRSQNADLAIIP